MGPQELRNITVGNSENARSPTQPLPFLAFQPPAHQPHLAEALVSVGEETGVCLAES